MREEGGSRFRRSLLYRFGSSSIRSSSLEFGESIGLREGERIEEREGRKEGREGREDVELNHFFIFPSNNNLRHANEGREGSTHASEQHRREPYLLGR